MKKRKLHSNIGKLYLIRGLGSFMLVMPVIVLFFQENGLSMKEIFLLQASFSLALLLLEVPSGYLADVFGRKKSIVIGSIVFSFGFLVYAQAHSFSGFLLAEILLGLGISFISGSDSAMLYDTLLAKEKEKNYKKTEGKSLGISLFSESLSAIGGGLLALISLRLPLYCDAVISLLSIPIALSLVEPKRSTSSTKENVLKNILKLVKFSLHDEKKIKWLIFYSATVSTSTLTMAWFVQPYFLATGVPLVFFGVAWSSLVLTAAFFSWKAYRLEEIIGKKRALILLLLLPVSGYFLLSSLWFIWSGAFILLFYVTRGINNPIILDHINGMISSDFRATILSVKNLIGRLLFVIVGPSVGWLSDAYSLKIALLTSGIIFLFLGLISLTSLKKNQVL